MRLSYHCEVAYLLLAVALGHVAVVRAQCYYPGGAWASEQYPCDKYAYTTLCCPTGWTCFSNNLCIATDPSVVSSSLPLGTAIRGTCTNPEWNDTACGSFCLNDPVSSNNGSVVPCGDNKWCCQPDLENGMCNCNSGDGTFQVSDGTAQTIIGVIGLDHTSTWSIVPTSAAQSSSVAGAVSTVSTYSTSTLSTVSTILMTSSSIIASSSILATFSSLPTSSSVVVLDNTIQSTSSNPTSSASSASATGQQILGNSVPVTSTTGFKVGIGTAAGVVLAALIGLTIWRVIARQRKQLQPREAVFGDGSDMGSRWENPVAREIPFQTAPVPNPYEDQGYAAGASQSASRTALAEQLAHNRRTIPRPRMVFGDGGQEGNPYADGYAMSGSGR